MRNFTIETKVTPMDHNDQNTHVNCPADEEETKIRQKIKKRVYDKSKIRIHTVGKWKKCNTTVCKCNEITDIQRRAIVEEKRTP